MLANQKQLLKTLNSVENIKEENMEQHMLDTLGINAAAITAAEHGRSNVLAAACVHANDSQPEYTS